MHHPWISGNKFMLLENGEAFFPRVFAVIAGARREVLIETFILYEDKVGWGLHRALLAAARGGAQIDLTVDAFGAPNLSEKFITPLTDAGVRVHIFNPVSRIFRRINYFRRLHRKLVVVDGMHAFTGGINYSADHLADFGPEAKQDYAVEIAGPIVSVIRSFARAALASEKSARRWLPWRAAQPDGDMPAIAGAADAMFVWRDNSGHPNDIERQYRLAIRLARQRIVIANAYFFPGYSFLRELRKAARRGVDVSLILQGNPDMQIVKTAAGMLYPDLLQAGVRIFEYCERPLHGKVALVDDEWATVGSSNLDPLSLSLNLEANVMIRDPQFTRQLDASLQHLMTQNCTEIRVQDLQESGFWWLLRRFVLFHFLRRFPAWTGWLPGHAPKLESLQSAPAVDGDPITKHARP